MIDDPDNRPPELDWKLSMPEGFEVFLDRSKEPTLEFSIANAVKDPEADPLYFVWYWEIPDGKLVPEVGNLSMTLDTCEQYSLRNATRVNVAVWVSDEPLDFDEDAEMFPIAYGNRPPAARFWTVELREECKD